MSDSGSDPSSSDQMDAHRLERNSAITGQPKLTRNEKRAVWISGAAALVTLLGLFFGGLFVGFSIDNPFLPGFYWIANVIAAISTGTLASTMSGFLLVKYEHKMGRRGRLLIEGTGGFAVFLLVIWVNPQDKMFKAADAVFSELLSDCRAAAAIGDSGLNSNARESCIRLIKMYPLRPEPYWILGRWAHAKQANGFESAAALFRQALERYGIQANPITPASSDKLALSDARTPRVSNVLSHFNFAWGDYLLTAYSRNEIPLVKVLDGFHEIIDASYVMTDKLLNENSDPDIWDRAYDARAKVYLYTFFLEGRKDTGYLTRALSAYEAALEKEKKFPLLLQYHKFVCLVLLEAQNAQHQEKASEMVREMLHSWSAFFSEKEIQNERQVFKELFIEAMANSREEPWRLTRAFGSVKFGGEEIRAFFLREPLLRAQLNDKVGQL